MCEQVDAGRVGGYGLDIVHVVRRPQGQRCVDLRGDAVSDLHVAVEPFRPTAVATPVVEPDVWDERGASVSVHLSLHGEIGIDPYGRSPPRAVTIAERGAELAPGDAAAHLAEQELFGVAREAGTGRIEAPGPLVEVHRIPLRAADGLLGPGDAAQVERSRDLIMPAQEPVS